MQLSTWLAFALAAAVMGLIPGPGVTSIVGYALSSGRRTAMASVVGIAIGNTVCMTVSMAGAGAVLAASARAFLVLKWAGALYLVALGVLAIARSRRGLEAGAAVQAPITPRAAFFSNLALGVFHPKTIVFFAAFAPQFISASGASYALQATALIATYTAVVATTDTAYALAAARASHLLNGPRARLWSKRAGGGVLIAAGVATAAVSRT